MRVYGYWVERKRLKLGFFRPGEENCLSKGCFLGVLVTSDFSFNSMKTSWLTIALLALTIIKTQGQVSQSETPAIASQGTQDTSWSVVSRAASQNIWQRVEYETLPDGRQVSHLHQYVELSTGLNFFDPKTKQWVESKEQIDILPDGTAAATQLQSPVYFPSDIGRGVIRLTTPEGVQLQNGPAFLDFDDGTNVVLIGAVTNAVGELISSNQVLYPDIFRGSGFRADLLCTVRKSGFESDLVFYEQIPDPASLGLGANARLQLLTEWFDTPEPAQTTSAASQADGLTDTTLRFGSTTIGQGKAFAIGTADANSPTPVYKSWLHLNGRTFLMEEVPYQVVAPQLEQLPASGSATAANANTASANSILRKVSARRLLPPARLVQTSTNAIQLAKADLQPRRGVVLDYVTITAGATNYVFMGDNTYYVSGEYNLSGTTTIEGNTVIKMNSGGQIDIDQNGTINCQTGPYRPAVFTSVNDNSVGNAFGSGSPAYGNVNTFLKINATNVSLHDLRFSYCTNGVHQPATPATIDLWNCQFKNVNVAVYAYNIGLHNVLISRATNLNAAVFVEGPSLAGEQVTADGGNAFIQADYSGGTVALTNCLVTSQTLLTGSAVTLFTNATVYLASPSSPVYQTVGAGSYYLTTNSPYRNAGTTNINPVLWTELQQKTTYPPIVYSSTTISVPTTFSPQVQRDTDTPDLGYHYDPLDYVFGGVEAKSNLTFTAGTVVGWFDTQSSAGYGIEVDKGATVTFSGTVTAPCWLARYDTVQESGNGNWKTVGWGFAITSNNSNYGYSSDAPKLLAQFTKFSSRNWNDLAYRDYTGFFVVRMSDCEFYAPHGGYDISLNLTNCLFFRLPPGVDCNRTNTSLTVRNCTAKGCNFCTFYVNHANNSTWPLLITDCVFDDTTISVNEYSGGNTNITFCDYNAFLTNANRLPVQNPCHDVTNLLSFNWQSNWLGNYYLPTNSPLINHGSVTADQVGLYHFTTQTNQVKETNSVVDIGYHYVAVDTNGVPFDTNGDGIPDYLEDANGNGLVDSGEIGWNIVGDLGLKVLITRPRNGTTLP